jgi:hypothetical protein
VSFDYPKAARTARSLIAKFGGTVTLGFDNQTFDNDAGTVANVETLQAVSAVVLPATRSKLERLGYQFDESVTRINKVAFIDGLSPNVAPRPGMRVTYSGTTYFVDGVNELDDQDGGGVLYTLALRR